MGVSIAVTRQDHSAAELRGLARTEVGAVACRILAIAHVLDGTSRADAAASCGMDRQTLRDWVHRFNADGIKGLANKAAPGRSPALSDDQMSELRQIVLAGPDLARDGVVRWRCCDLQGVIAERFGVAVHERTVGKLLGRLRLTRLQPRPHNPKRDETAQEVFKRLLRPSNGGTSGRGGREAAGGLVRGRGARRSAGHLRRSVERGRLAPCRGP